MLHGYYRIHYRLRHVVTAFAGRAFDNYTYIVRHGLTKGMKRRGGLGFLPRLPWEKDSPETSFIKSLPLTGKVVYDVGAFIGTMSLYFSTKAKQVVAFEPVNYRRLRENLQLNQIRNVSVYELGIGSQEETREIAYDWLMPGAASGDSEVRQQILQTSNKWRTTTIRIVPLDSLHDLPAPNLIKIDIEGMEMEALKGMRGILRTFHPDLYIELHGATSEQKKNNACAVVRFLKDNGYSTILHIESGTTFSTTDDASVPHRGHLFCS